MWEMLTLKKDRSARPKNAKQSSMEEVSCVWEVTGISVCSSSVCSSTVCSSGVAMFVYSAFTSFWLRPFLWVGGSAMVAS